MENLEVGFYVDVGAHHPQRFSNTYYFYKMGWMGINIDAMPGSMKKFEKIRPRDINVEIAVNDVQGKIKYYAFNDSALNTFSSKLAKVYREKYRMIFTREIEAMPLSQILDRYLPRNKKIDFLSIDVEKFELNVLKSNNWSKYVPKIILVEMLDNRMDSLNTDDIYQFLIEKNYQLVSKTPNTAIFKRNV
jgi:FkbM family methyltransferase